MEKWFVSLLLMLYVLTVSSQNEHVEMSDTLREVTVTSRSVQKRVQEIQIGVERVEVATLAKVPALFGEKDIIKSIQL